MCLTRRHQYSNITSKGNASVILDHEQYQAKIDELLSDKAFRTVSKDPTGKVERRLIKLLKATCWEDELKPRSSCPPPDYMGCQRSTKWVAH